MAASPQFPIVMTAAGAQPTPPTTLRAALVAYVQSIDPGFTDNLPGSLIEDLVSTSVGAMVVMDQARVDTINSVTPYGANQFLLLELGEIYGVPPGVDTNTNVYVAFTGTPGFPINNGFIVSDGTYQYVVSDGGTIVPTGGVTGLVYCVATQAGIWAVPANTVEQISTSLPAGVVLTCNNPNTGTPSAGDQTEEDYRSQVLQAGKAASQGMETYLKTLLGNVPGVQQRLIAAQQVAGLGWKVIVGGGDPYSVANAIYQAGVLIPFLQPSVIGIAGITKANPGVVTTNLNHGLVTGQNNVFIAGVLGMTEANGGPYTVTVLTETTFSFDVDTTGFGTWTGGGVVTPNPRNLTVDINSYPDTYAVQIVVPPSQSVAVDLTWNTIATSVVSSTAIAQLGAPAIANYINSIPVGQPINVFELIAVFQAAVASIVSIALLTRIVVGVAINGVSVAPEEGTGIIQGDPESYMLTTTSAITIAQG